MEHRIVFLLVMGILVLGIFLYTEERLYASERIEEARSEVISRFIINMVNEKIPPADSGPADVDLVPLADGTYSYRITVIPKLKIAGEHPSDTNIISIIRFKGSGIRATVKDPAGDDDKFTISPNEDSKEPRLTAEITTDVPPIAVFKRAYDRPLRENTPILIRSDTGAVLTEVFVTRSYKPVIDPNKPGLSECRAEFSLRCADNPVVYSSYLRDCCISDDCNPKGKPGDCAESIEICGGIATINIDNNPDYPDNNPDCSTGTVNIAGIEYEGGKEWAAGEYVYVSFWKDTDCTRQISDYRQLNVRCCKEVKNCDRVSDEFKLNAGCLPPYGAECDA